MLDRILDFIDPYIVEGILLILTTYFGVVYRTIFRTKASQDSLHKALTTGVDGVTDRIAEMLTSSAEQGVRVGGPALVDRVVDYVKGSIPDSLKFLKASDTQLYKMADAKIKARAADMAAQLSTK